DTSTNHDGYACHQAFLGVRGVYEEFGFEVHAVKKGSPADDSKLVPGDVIISVDGFEVSRENPIIDELSCLQEETTVTLSVLRYDGNLVDFIKLDTDVFPGMDEMTYLGYYVMGVSVKEVPFNLYDKYSLPYVEAGLLVTEVQPGSGAHIAGMQRGDFIVSFNYKHLFSLDDLANYSFELEDGTSVRVIVSRDGEYVELLVPLFSQEK
ncbi:MAG: PDZ domain-containing protein, partial [Proteobacteria bacterium]|nr:PDZ domain-containing protein [Pseudomonadota bacterium]